jgi:hypothetical protein
MSYRCFYIDDNSEDIKYADLLENEQLIFERTSPKDLSIFPKEIINFKPDAIITDYRLDDDQKNNRGNNYRASTLAQFLRDSYSKDPANDFPIILVSSEEKIREYFKPEKTAHDLFDEWYFKSTIIEHSDKIAREIESVIKGYKKISNIIIKNGNKFSLFNLPEKEHFIFDNTNLDIELDQNITHLVARVFLRNIIKRPGILLGPADVYAKLGIGLKDYCLKYDDIWSKLEENNLCYQGIFSDGWPRVWRHRFDFYFKEHFSRMITAFSSEERVTKVNELWGLNYAPAESRWTHSTNEAPSFACASCHHPTEIENSISAYDPHVPKYVEKKRICLDCIESDRESNLGLSISSEDKKFSEKIKSGTLRSQNANS